MTNLSATDPTWQRIANAAIDDPRANFPLSARLARDNGWSSEFAARVVEEYRRFCYLAVTSGREVTPSDEVDQAWHLHILYTEHYWGAWTEALGAPLHHGPTKGGTAEGNRFWDQYETTLALYGEAFGEEPPTDIWPAPTARFDRPGRFKRIDTSQAFVLNRADLKPASFIMAASVFLTLLVSERLDHGSLDSVAQAGFFRMPDNPKPFIFGGVLGLLGIAVWLVTRRSSSGKGGSGCGAGGTSSDGDGGSGCGSGCGGCGG